MPAIHIRDVPPEDLDALKRRAARNHRSLQAELRMILSQIARTELSAEPLPPIRLHLSSATPSISAWRRSEIYDDDGR